MQDEDLEIDVGYSSVRCSFYLRVEQLNPLEFFKNELIEEIDYVEISSLKNKDSIIELNDLSGYLSESIKLVDDLILYLETIDSEYSLFSFKIKLTSCIIEYSPCEFWLNGIEDFNITSYASNILESFGVETDIVLPKIDKEGSEFTVTPPNDYYENFMYD